MVLKGDCMKDNSTFDKDFVRYLIWFILGALLICVFPWLFTQTYFHVCDFSEKGQVGDTIGGIMGPFVAIAAAGLTFIAFWVQYKANIQQRHDIAIERFESNLFEMIHIQQEITNGLLIQEYAAKGIVNMSQKGRDVFQFVYETATHEIWLGDECRKSSLKHALRLSDEVKMEVPSLKKMWFLDHYYRHLYRIFKYIDDAEENLVDSRKKYEYACIVRATLSQYELIMLFYSGFYHQRFKRLIEKYAILNNLRFGLLASDRDISLYSSKLSPQYSYDEDEGRNMEMEYRKSAFVWPKGG